MKKLFLICIIGLLILEEKNVYGQDTLLFNARSWQDQRLFFTEEEYSTLCILENDISFYKEHLDSLSQEKVCIMEKRRALSLICYGYAVPSSADLRTAKIFMPELDTSALKNSLDTIKCNCNERYWYSSRKKRECFRSGRDSIYGQISGYPQRYKNIEDSVVLLELKKDSLSKVLNRTIQGVKDSRRFEEVSWVVLDRSFDGKTEGYIKVLDLKSNRNLYCNSRYNFIRKSKIDTDLQYFKRAGNFVFPDKGGIDIAEFLEFDETKLTFTFKSKGSEKIYEMYWNPLYGLQRKGELISWKDYITGLWSYHTGWCCSEKYYKELVRRYGKRNVHDAIFKELVWVGEPESLLKISRPDLGYVLVSTDLDILQTSSGSLTVGIMDGKVQSVTYLGY